MSTPDVRVKLSAEGVDEVVRALQKVNEAAKKTGKEGGAALTLMSEGAAALAAALPAISFGAVLAGIVTLTKNALDSADAIGKLSQKTGISTEALSVLNVAAQTANVGFDQLTTGLEKFNKTAAAVDRGSAEAGASVRRLFGSSAALNGLNTEDKFTKVAGAIAKMGDGYQKTAAAQDFFGKAGAELIPLLNDLGEGGFDKAREKAERLGLVIDQDLANAAQRANDAITSVKQEVQGAATQFAAGLAPAIEYAATELANLSDGNKTFKDLGEAAGELLRDLTLGFEVVFIGIKLGFDSFMDSARTDLDIVKTYFKGLWDTISTGSVAAFEKAGAQMRASVGAFDARQKARLTLAGVQIDLAADRANAPPGPAARRPPPGGGGGGQDTAAEKAQLDLLKARLENELKLYKQFDGLAEAQAKAAFDHHFIDLTQYFDRRRAILTAELDEDVKTLEAKRKLIEQTPTENAAGAIKKKQEIEAIDSEIQAKTIERQQKVLALEDERFNKEKEIAQLREDTEKRILEAQGKTYEAALVDIEKQAQSLRDKGVDPALIDKLTGALTAKATFANVQQLGGNAVSELENQQSAIANQVAGGEIFPAAAAERYAAAVRAALPALREYAEQLKASAVTPDEQIAAEQYAQKIEALGIAADSTRQQMATLKAGVQSALEGGLSTFLTEATDGAHSLKDAFRDAVSSIVKSLQQMVTQMLVNLAIQKLLGMFGGGGAGGIAGALIGGGSAGGAVAVAEGGLIDGPGTATSDSIPAWISAGEFMEPGHAVDHYGAGVFEAMRHHAIPREIFAGLQNYAVRPVTSRRFAEGGLVGPGGGAGADGAAGAIRVALDKGLIAEVVEDHMRGDAGRKIIIEHASDNPKQIRSALRV